MVRDHERCERMMAAAAANLSLDREAWPAIYEEIHDNFEAIYAQFNLTSDHANKTMDGLSYAIRKMGLELTV
jgi:hypothetical protein